MLALGILGVAEGLAPGAGDASRALAAPLGAHVRQATTETATPRIVLPDLTPSPAASPSDVPTRISGTPGPGTSAPGTSAPGTAVATGSAPAATGSGSGGSGPGGSGPAATAAARRTSTAVDIAPPALPGTAVSPDLGGGAETAATVESGGSSSAGAGALVGRARAPDRAAEAMWQRYGSPRAGQPVAERMTADRPGPWGWLVFYGLLGLGWLWLVVRIGRELLRLKAGG
jgi:hypothetical protein